MSAGRGREGGEEEMGSGFGVGRGQGELSCMTR